MVSSKRPCVNRKAKKHSQIALTLAPGEPDFDDVNTTVQDPVVDKSDPTNLLKWHPIKVKSTKKKLKFKMQADVANRAALKKKLGNGVPDGTLSITLISYPAVGSPPFPVVPTVDVDYIVEDEQ